MVAELVDNAIAAKENGFNIKVDISKIATSSSQYIVTVVDDGPGISLGRLRQHVFKTGSPPAQGSSHLNEHGFGLKNVLAKVEELKGNWWVQTRDQLTLKSDTFYEIKSPLSFRIPIYTRATADWPPFGSNSTGTIVRFEIPLSYLQTVTRGRRGAPPATVDGVLNYLREHLGVFYRGYLEGGRKAPGTICTSLSWNDPVDVEPVFPDYSSRDLVRRFTVNLPAGKVEIEGEYGLLETASETTRNERVYYYRNTPESQGIDIRIGKRVVATRLLTEIWQRARHPSYNALWGEFRIEPAIAGRTPKTLNNKTAINFDDETWQTIAQAIRQKVPELPKSREARQEAELRELLLQQLKAHKLGKDIVEENYPCFRGSGVVIDIYRDESARTGELMIYETKVGKAHPQDVYQVRLYWDGLVEDGKQPTRAYLVADTKTTGTSTVINAVNSYTDKKGNRYKLEFKTWSDFNIDV